MSEQTQDKSPNAWIAIDHGLAAGSAQAPYTLQLEGEHSLYQAITDDDWVLSLNTSGHITRVGRVMRYAGFDRPYIAHPAVLRQHWPYSMDGLSGVTFQDVAQDHRRSADH